VKNKETEETHRVTLLTLCYGLQIVNYLMLTSAVVLHLA
jgi:hypothetical protein